MDSQRSRVAGYALDSVEDFSVNLFACKNEVCRGREEVEWSIFPVHGSSVAGDGSPHLDPGIKHYVLANLAAQFWREFDEANASAIVVRIDRLV